MFGFEPVLCCDVWYVLCYVRKNHLLECLCDNRRPNVDVFVRFSDRYDFGQFPNMRYLAVVDCSVVYVREVL